MSSVKRTLLACVIAMLVAETSVAADFASTVMEATFKLFSPESSATCFFIRRKSPDAAFYLVTAAHVLEHAKHDTIIVVLRQQKADGSFDRRDHTIPIRRDGKPLWVQHEKQDVAVLRLGEGLPIAVAALPASVIADAAQLKAAGLHICSSLFVLTYPQRFEANKAGFPVARHGIFASPPLLPLQIYPTFLADFTTFGGDSGGPVFVAGPEDRPLLVGMVIAQFRHDERVTTEYEERTIHHPLGMGTVLHAQYLRETLDAAAKPKVPISSK